MAGVENVGFLQWLARDRDTRYQPEYWLYF
jgi:hypothetical protein